MSLFQPELFRITGTHNVHVQKRSLGDPEDPYDENYLRETSVSGCYLSSLVVPVLTYTQIRFNCFLFQRRGIKETLDHSSEMQEEAAAAPATAGDDEVVVDAVGDPVPSLSNRDLDAPRDFVIPQQLLGLDQAILQSIERCCEQIFINYRLNKSVHS